MRMTTTLSRFRGPHTATTISKPLTQLVLLLAALFLPLQALQAQVDLIVNGGFEEPAIASSYVQVNAGQVTIPDWTVVSGSVDIVRQDGNQWLDLNGMTAGEIQQTITGAIGEVRLSFTTKVINQNYNAQGEVYWNNDSLGIVKHPTAYPMRSYFIVTATGNDVLRFKSLATGSAGVYIDSVLCEHSPQVLCTEGAPVLTAVLPQSGAVWLKQNIALAVGVTGECPVTFEWYRNGEPLAGATGSTVTISNAQVTDAGEYHVQVSNSKGTSISADAVLKVVQDDGTRCCKGPPLITMQPCLTVALPGQTVTVSVGAEGECPMSFQWYYEGEPIAGATDRTLALQNVEPSQAGLYSAAAINSLGSAKSISAVLVVRSDAAPRVLIDGVFLDTPGTVKRADRSIVTMSTTFSGGSIYYTTDGSRPSFAAMKYTGPFERTSYTTLRAIAYSTDFAESAQMGPIEIVIVPAAECYTLTASVVGEGAITGFVPPGGVYPEGTVVSISAQPSWVDCESGWSSRPCRVKEWQGAMQGTSPNIATLTVNEDQAVVVVFEPAPIHCITATCAGGGSAYGEGGWACDNPGCSFAGDTLSALAEAAPGWEFLEWRGDIIGGTAWVDEEHLMSTISFAANRDKHVEAVFGTSVDTSVTGPGSLSVVPQSDEYGRYSYGTIVSVIGQPDAGHYLAAWGGAGSGSFNPITLPLTEPNPSIVCLFAPIPADKFLLTVDLAGDGSVAADPAKNIFSAEETVTLTATATGVQPFVGWTGDAVGQEASITVTMDSNKTITANFNRAPVIDPIADQVVDELSSLKVTPTAYDPDLSSQALPLILVNGPEGAAIDPVTGQLEWTPTETQGQGVYTFTVKVSDSGAVPLSAEKSFTVTVNELNVAPTLELVRNQVVAPGELLEVQLVANDADVPANMLSYDVLTGPPSATIEPLTGLFQWQTQAANANETHSVTVAVTDNAEPPLSATATFTVCVGQDMTWAAVASSADVTLRGVESGPAGWVAVGDAGTILTSPDGTTWTAQSTPTAVALWGVKYATDGFIVAGDNGTLLTSTDGVAWTATESGVTTDMRDVAYGNGHFVVVGAAATILTSSAGTGPWEKQTVATTKDIYSISFGDGHFVAVGGQGLVLTSPDGATWTVQDPVTAIDLRAAGYGHGHWWAGGIGGLILGSLDLATWAEYPSGMSTTVEGIGYGHGRIAAVGGSGTGMNGGHIVVSRDGETWRSAFTGVIGTLHDIAFDGETWLAVGEAGTVLRSTQLLPPWHLDLAVAGPGTVQRIPDQELYADGSTVALTAAGLEGCGFAGWAGDLTGEEPSVQFTMDGHKAVTAHFVPGYILRVELQGQGNFTLTPDLPYYVPGQVVTLSVSSETYWVFREWTGDAQGSTNPVSISMNSNKSIAAFLSFSPPGSKRWEFATGGRVSSSPTIDTAGTVYVGSWDGKVYAVDSRTGEMRWNFPTGGYVLASPAIGPNRTVYVGSWDNRVYALDRVSGQKLWDCETADDVWSSAAIEHHGTVYVGSSDGKLHALDGATGQELWEFMTRREFRTCPAIDAEGTVYTASYDGTVYALDSATGVKHWEFLTGSLIGLSSPALGARGTLYVGARNGKLYALDKGTGQMRWEFLTNQRGVESSPAIGQNGRIYVGSLDSKLYAVDAETGQKIWEFMTGGGIYSSPVIGADGTAYVGSSDNVLYAVDGTSGQKLWEFYPVDGESTPAIGPDGTLYVGGLSGRLYAIWGGAPVGDPPWPMFHQNAQHTGLAKPPPNQPPVIATITGAMITEISALEVQCTATDPDLPYQQLTWTLIQAPQGAMIDTESGRITWTPTDLQGPGVYTIAVRVTDNGVPPLSGETSFTVTVLDPQHTLVNAPHPAQPGSPGEQWNLYGVPGATDRPGILEYLYGVGNFTQVPDTEDVVWRTDSVLGGEVELLAIHSTIDQALRTASLDASNVSEAILGGPAGVPQTPTRTGVPTSFIPSADPFVWAADDSHAGHWYSGPWLNGADGNRDHMVTFAVTGYLATPGDPETFTAFGAPACVIAFDGELDGDYDFNDLVVEVRGVTPSRGNEAPQLDLIADQTVDELSLVTLPGTASDSDLASQTLTYALLSGPEGATIDAETGLFQWQTTETDGGRVVPVQISVTDDGVPSLSATNEFLITVFEVNSAPVLAAIADVEGTPGTPVQLQFSATDSDVPLNALQFQMANAPAGASLDPVTGIYTWLPIEPKGDQTIEVTVTVQDNGDPVLTDSKSFNALVRATDPVVTLESPLAGEPTDERAKLAGSVTDDVGVAAVEWQWNGDSMGALTLTGDQFEMDGLKLKAGPNVFRVLARDAAGNEGAAEVTVTWTPLRTLAVGDSPAVQEGLRVSVPVELTSGGDVGSLNLVLHYDPVCMRDPQWTWGAALSAASTAVNTNVLGEVRATFSLGGAALAAGAVGLAEVDFRARSVPATLASDIAPEVLDIGDPQGNKLVFGTHTEHGEVTITPRSLLGDNNGNDRLDVGDGTLIQRLLTGLDEVRLWDVTGNDLNANTELDSGDVTRLLRVVVGIDPPPGGLAGPQSTQGRSARRGVGLMGPNDEALLLVPDTLSAEIGQRVKVQLVLTNLQGTIVGAFFKMEYPANALRVPDAAAHVSGLMVPSGALTLWNLVPDGDYANQTGTLAFVASSTTAWPGTDGVIAEVEFEVQPGAAEQPEWTIRLVEIEVSANGFDNRALPDTDARFAVPVVNSPPVLSEVANQALDEGSLLAVDLEATDPEIPAQQLTWSLVTRPEGATIDPLTGLIEWTPTEQQGPGEYAITVRVTDSGTPPLSDEQTFTVTVNEVNVAPELGAIGDRVVVAGDLVEVQLTATDVDEPKNTLAFELVSGPEAATVDPATGLFRWQTTLADAGLTAEVTVKVSDDGEPPLSASTSFTVTVGQDMTWQTLASGAGVALWGVEWGGESFVAVGANGKILSSPDGIVWTEQTSPTANTLWGLEHAQGRFVVAGHNGTLLTSTDGASWAAMESGVTTHLTDVAYGNGRFVVVGTGATILTSTDGLGPWQIQEVATTKNFQDITYGAGYFVASGTGGLVATSADGLTWTVHDAGTTAGVMATGYAHDKWWVGGSAGLILGSPDRVTWTSYPSGVSTAVDGFGYGHGRLCAVGGSGSGMNGGFIVLSRDGLAWERAFTGVIPTLYDIAFSGETWVAVGEGGAVVRSMQLLPPWELAVSSVGGGTVQRMPDQALYADGTTVTLTASAADGWVFAGWSSDLEGTENPAQVIMGGDRAVTAMFSAVNRPPALAAIADQTINEGALVAVNLEATDPDLPAQNLAFALLNGPAGAAVDPATGELTWQPDESNGGQQYTFEVRVTDDGIPPLSAQRSFTVTVTEVNSAPELAVIPDQTIPEGTVLSVTAIATDADLPGDVLTFSLLTAPDGATIDAETGVITWPTTEAHGPGVYAFTVQVFDNGDPARSGEQGFQVTVLEVNMPPTLDAIAAVSGDELTALTFTATGTDADLPKQGLSFRLEGAPDGAAIDPATGAFAWTPSEEQGPGVYPIDVILADDGAPPLSVTQQVTVTVREVNAPPTLASITDQSARAGQLLTVPIETADSDVPANQLMFELVQAPSGAAIDPAARLFQWTPAIADMGVHSITVKVTDDGEPALETSREFSVTVENYLEISAELAGPELLIRFPTITGARYRVEAATDLAAPVWQTLVAEIVGAGSTRTVAVSISAGQPHRFYRVIQLP